MTAPGVRAPCRRLRLRLAVVAVTLGTALAGPLVPLASGAEDVGVVDQFRRPVSHVRAAGQPSAPEHQRQHRSRTSTARVPSTDADATTASCTSTAAPAPPRASCGSRTDGPAGPRPTRGPPGWAVIGTCITATVLVARAARRAASDRCGP